MSTNFELIIFDTKLALT